MCASYFLNAAFNEQQKGRTFCVVNIREYRNGKYKNGNSNMVLINGAHKVVWTFRKHINSNRAKFKIDGMNN